MIRDGVSEITSPCSEPWIPCKRLEELREQLREQLKERDELRAENERLKVELADAQRRIEDMRHTLIDRG